MAVISGIGGAVNGESTVRNWSIESFNDPVVLGVSSGKGGDVAVCGPDDWTGRFLASGYIPYSAIFPGQTFTFTGDLGNGKGATGSAFVDQLEITADIERQRPVEYEVRFSRNGALTLGAAVAADATTPTIYCPAGLYVSLGTKIVDTRFWKLILRTRAKPYVDSETNGGVKRLKGNMGGQWIVRAYLSDPSTLPVVGTNYPGLFYVTSLKKYEINWCKVLRIQDLGADNESQENVGAIISGVCNAWSGTSIGVWITPDGATKWPV